VLLTVIMFVAAARVSRSFQLPASGGRLTSSNAFQRLTRARMMSQRAAQSPPTWQIDLLYDGECPLCLKEIDFLKKRDTEGKIQFTDLASPGYKQEEHGNVDFERGMRSIHAVTSSGDVISGVEVFRRVYEAIGLGWVYAATKLPVIGPAVDVAYDIWASNRLRLTGRPDLAKVMEERAAKLRDKSAYPQGCEDECAVPAEDTKEKETEKVGR